MTAEIEKKEEDEEWKRFCSTELKVFET
jgi:hypothetical protein